MKLNYPVRTHFSAMMTCLYERLYRQGWFAGSDIFTEARLFTPVYRNATRRNQLVQLESGTI
jgi:hypothetical protein